MIQKKVCMIGSFAVGKTSLVSRFVRSVFSEKYHTTIGVKVDKKTVRVRDQEVELILWDIHGDDAFQRISLSYLRGASGYLIVADGTRPETWREAILLRNRVEDATGSIPFVLALNKKDLPGEWQMEAEIMAEEVDRGSPVIETSAKTGMGVEAAFLKLTELILDPTAE